MHFRRGQPRRRVGAPHGRRADDRAADNRGAANGCHKSRARHHGRIGAIDLMQKTACCSRIRVAPALGRETADSLTLCAAGYAIARYGPIASIPSEVQSRLMRPTHRLRIKQLGRQRLDIDQCRDACRMGRFACGSQCRTGAREKHPKERLARRSRQPWRIGPCRRQMTLA